MLSQTCRNPLFYQCRPSLPLVSIRQSIGTEPTTPIDTANTIKKPAALMTTRHYGKGHWRQTQQPSHICLTKSLTQYLHFCKHFILVETANYIWKVCNKKVEIPASEFCLLPILGQIWIFFFCCCYTQKEKRKEKDIFGFPSRLPHTAEWYETSNMAML